MTENCLVRKNPCHRCPIACGRWVRLKDGSEVGGPEYETLWSFGSDCDVYDLDAVNEANMLCNEYGLDTISAGATIAAAMELYQRGYIKDEEIDIETEKLIEYLTYDYNWIVNSFNDGKSLAVIPEAYSNLLKSVSYLIEKDKNLSMFKLIKFYSVKEDKIIAGHIKEKDYKKLKKQDKIYLYQFSID